MRRALLPAALAALAAAAVLISAPPGFDSLDGAEYCTAARSLGIAHPPSHPLFLMLLHLAPGDGWTSCMALCALLAAALLLLARTVSDGSTAAAVLLFSVPPLFGQLDTVEVHGLAGLAALAAAAARGTRAGPYAFGMAVAAGHPINILLAPALAGRGWRWWASAALPLSLMLYVPIRAAAGVDPHYTSPETLDHLLAYSGAYSGRLAPPALPQGFDLPGLCGIGAMALLAALGRPRPGEAASVVLSIAFLSCYRVPDPQGMALPLLISLWLPASRAVRAFVSIGGAPRRLTLLLVAAVCATGIASGGRSGDEVAPTLSRDMMRSAPPGAVYATVGHDTFHAAYLTAMEDLRPDLVPADLYGNYFGLRLAEPLPAFLGSRPVTATRAWESPELALSGLLFRGDGGGPCWESMDFFGSCPRSPDGYALDAAAEAYARRALQSSGLDRGIYAARAMALATGGTARARIGAMLDAR